MGWIGSNDGDDGDDDILVGFDENVAIIWWKCGKNAWNCWFIVQIVGKLPKFG